MSEADLRERIARLEEGQRNIVDAVSSLAKDVKTLTHWQARLIGAGVFAYAALGLWMKYKLG